MRRDQRMVAADILNVHGAEFIGFDGKWAWQGLTAARATADANATKGLVAKRPEQIPSLFAQAWNDRKPDALASLFDEDAEFVNVTGLWWHDRVSIRKAYAYGLERIFNDSVLTIDELKEAALG